MKNTRALINSYNITNVPKYVSNYLDGKCNLTRKIAIYIDDILFLPKGTIELYEREYKKWMDEVI